MLWLDFNKREIFTIRRKGKKRETFSVETFVVRIKGKKLESQPTAIKEP